MISRRSFCKSAFALAASGLWLPKAQVAVFRRKQQAAGGGTRTYLVNQDCEGTGTPSGWSDYAGTEEWDYTTNPPEGSQCLRCARAPGSEYSQYTISAASELWLYFRCYINTLPGAEVQFCALRTGSTYMCECDITAAGLLNVYIPNGSTRTVDGLATATQYHVWVYWKKGTGSDAIGSIGFSTDGVKPTTGNKYTSKTNGTATSDVTVLEIGNRYSTTFDFQYDVIRLDTASIGDDGA